MLTDAQLSAGIARNNKELDEALSKQLYLIYNRLVPDSNQVRYIVPFPLSCVEYHLEYINIGFPSNVNLNNFFFVVTSDANGIKYVSENLRRNILGAKVNLFTTPNSDNNLAVAGDQKQFTSMIPLNLTFKGTEQATFFFRGAGLSDLEYVDFLLTGHQEGRKTRARGYHGNI
jgi:hypothetical protein